MHTRVCFTVLGLSISKTMLRFYAKLKMSMCIISWERSHSFYLSQKGPWSMTSQERINALHKCSFKAKILQCTSFIFILILTKCLVRCVHLI